MTLDVPVLIVGGGGSGLCASSFLAGLGIDSLLIERHAGTSHLPKAHYLNQRTMEIFRQHDMADSIYARSAPREAIGKINWRTPLGGDGPLDRWVFKQIDAMGSGEFTARYDRHGVTPPTHIAQIRLEPILRELAEQRNPGRVAFRHELTGFSQDDTGIEAHVRNLETGEERVVRARYLIAADAGKTVGPALGINMIAAERIRRRISVFFSADLSAYIHDDKAAMHCIVNPNGAKAGRQLFAYLVAYGPTRWGRHSSEWGMGLAFGPDETIDLDAGQLADRIRAFLQIDVPIEILGHSQWFQEAMIASRFVDGRIYQIGDAAHKHPPASGLGLNSGIQDAHNLCWKLALVLNGRAGPNLLESYEAERRPVVERNAEHATLVMSNFQILAASLGLAEDMPPTHNQRQLAALAADTPDGAARRARMDHVFELTRSETGAQGMDLGFTYEAGARIADGTPPLARDPTGILYTPSTRPGSRLPHIWVDQDGRRLSTHDLIPMGGFLLLTGEAGYVWDDAARLVRDELGIPIRCARIGESEARACWDFWVGVREINEDGALLIRPDGHVAFRTRTAPEDAVSCLASAMLQVLAGAQTDTAAMS